MPTTAPRLSPAFLDAINAWLASDPVNGVAPGPDASACVAWVAERAKSEVYADAVAGRVPASCRSFAALHDFVDANAYGGAFTAPLPDPDAASDRELEESAAFWNAVQDAVDDWLAAGGLAPATA